MKIVGYVSIPTDRLKAAKDVASEYEIREKIKQDTHIVHCIPLSELDSFGTYEELSRENLEIVQKEGFALDSVCEDGICIYKKGKYESNRLD